MYLKKLCFAGHAVKMVKNLNFSQNKCNGNNYTHYAVKKTNQIQGRVIESDLTEIFFFLNILLYTVVGKY